MVGQHAALVGGLDDGVGEVGVVAVVVGADDEDVAVEVEAVDEVDPAEVGGEGDGAGVVGQLSFGAVGVGVDAVAVAVEGVELGFVEQAAADGVAEGSCGESEFCLVARRIRT